MTPSIHAFAGDNLPSSGSTLFFDDFLSSQFPQNWISQIANNIYYNVSQTNGYLITVNNAGNFQKISGVSANLLANVSGTPVFGTLTPESVQFIQIVFKLQAFNITNLVARQNGVIVNWFAEVQLGLNTLPASPTGVGSDSIYFDLFDSNSQLNGPCGSSFPVTKQAVFLQINKPMPSASNNYFLSCPGGAHGTQNGILYTGGDSGTQTQLDLNAQHIFTIQIEMDKGNNANDWVRYQVDSLAWEGYSQNSCSCIVGTTGDVASLYPFISGAGLVMPNTPPTIVSQSLGTSIDYVLVTNYVPATLPAGQLLFSNIHPPTKLPQPYNIFGPSDSLVGFMQFQANSIAPGNIYAGGLLLTGIIVAVIGGTLGAIIWRTKRGLREMGFMWSLSSLGIVFFNFYCGIVPIWLPAIQTILSAGIVFGIIRTGSPGSGGIVPD